ncbi:MAG: nucleotidyltransferase family protein [Dechloromonas sp.]|nr:nucleotidyltransferase family protein [Dechloromonas sp.]
MSPKRHPLIQFLRNPRTTIESLSLCDWSQLICAARRGHLLSRVAHLVCQHNQQNSLPEKVRPHIESALRVAESQRRNVLWEITQIHRALKPRNIPFIVLKGGAYIVMGYEAGVGRVMSDVDIMVPQAHIIDAERTLIENGWFPGKLNAYDQRYYRTWMHELPPLHHLKRGTSLDVHHTILPPTAALKPDVTQLWDKALASRTTEGVFALAPADMILHSAAHLFHDGEVEHGLRDLVDIDSLLTQFAKDDEFWIQLTQRAVELNLSRPLYYALQCCRIFLQTSIPDNAVQASKTTGNLNGAATHVVVYLLTSAIGAILNEGKHQTLATSLAKFLIFVRSHYLRMPMYLLIPHLTRKMLFAKEER